MSKLDRLLLLKRDVILGLGAIAHMDGTTARKSLTTFWTTRSGTRDHLHPCGPGIKAGRSATHGF